LQEKRGLKAADLAKNYNHPLTLATILGFKPLGAPMSAGVPVATKPTLATPNRTGIEPAWTAVKGDVVPIRSSVEPKLVAVVGASDLLPSSGKQMYEVPDLQSKLAKFDVDKNRVINGKDWRNLTMLNSRITLSRLLYQSRTGKAECPPDILAQVMAKIDWVYEDASRRDLTLNQAWDTPSHHFEPIRW
jgi:hypothetical protein